MEHRQRFTQTSKPPIKLDPPAFALGKVAIVAGTALQATNKAGPRPLSDIRELSEPSIVNPAILNPITHSHAKHGPSRASTLRSKASSQRIGSIRPAQPASRPTCPRNESGDAGSSSYSSSPEPTSCYNIPLSSVPRRSSSQTQKQRPEASTRDRPSVPSAPALPGAPYTAGERFTVPNRGQSRSPVKETGLRFDAVRSASDRPLPSHTFIRSPPPMDILDAPSYRHPRIKLELQVMAPLFVGGGSVEGAVKVTVDDHAPLRHRRSLGLASVSVDLLGFEDMPGGRRAPFLALGTNLLDADNPPPPDMVEPENPLAPDDRFWPLSPSVCSIPYMLSLPLDTGPPPFSSKHASIRFMLSATALIRDAGKLFEVRTTRDINVLATYDPEKVLASLSSPMTASDTLTLPRLGIARRSGGGTLRLTAGLHRQVWVGGSSVFVDVHLANRTRWPVKRLELSLERAILCYRHTPASTRERSIGTARVSESSDRMLVAQHTLKVGDPSGAWHGVEAQQSATRTCELQLPRGLATVRCGRFFEVRFFLNVSAALSASKTVAVQLPLILVHINSLDVVPNSVAQVAAAIEEEKKERTRHNDDVRHRRHQDRERLEHRKHHRQRSISSPAEEAELRRKPSASYPQGRAFAAPRQQSAERLCAAKLDMDDIRRALDESPRKHRPTIRAVHIGPTVRKVRSDTSMSMQPLRSTSAAVSGELICTPPPPLPPAQLLQRYQRRVSGVENVPLAARPFGQPPRATTVSAGGAISSGPPYNFTVTQHLLEPHTLGLGGLRSLAGPDPVTVEPPRPGTGFSFRGRQDRRQPKQQRNASAGRYEVGGLQRKATSESLKERGRAWFRNHVRSTGGDDAKSRAEVRVDKEPERTDQMGREREKQRVREGWI